MSAMDDPAPIADTPSKPRLRFRRTRIAVSVFFGLLTVALCALWVRSYYGIDWILGPVGGGKIVTLTSMRGSLWITNVPPPRILKDGKTTVAQQWYRFSAPISMAKVGRSFGFDMHSTGMTIGLPYWLLVPGSAVPIALSVRSLPRFSLRTLLIVTALVAVVLGLVCYTVR